MDCLGSEPHLIEFEGEFLIAIDTKYPLCIDGKQACPPEDVGGSYSYPNFINAMKNKTHPDHEMYVKWMGTEKFDPNEFNASKVKFKTKNYSSQQFRRFI